MTNHVALSFGGWCRRLVVGVDPRFDSYLFKFPLFSVGFDLAIYCNGCKTKEGGKENKTSCAVPRTSLYPQAPYLDFTNVYHMEYNSVLIISSSSLQNMKDWTMKSKRIL
jgi:hypothetical protein